MAKDSTLSFGDTIVSTDIEVWSETTAYRTALTASGPRDLAKLNLPIKYVEESLILARIFMKDH